MARSRAEIREAIRGLADDRESGAAALVTRAAALLEAARGLGPEELVETARALCRAQPAMAGLWNAAVAALADRSGDALARFAARAGRAGAAMARLGRDLLDGEAAGAGAPLRLATFSNSGSVLAVLVALAGRRPVEVACGEGRPAGEGRLMAAALAGAGVPVDLHTDAGLGASIVGCRALVVGADAVLPEAFVNKAGTAAIAALAASRGVPVYVVASADKFACAALAPLLRIEERPASEVWASPPPGVRVRNVCFERVPLEMVTALVTDRGVLATSMVAEACRASGRLAAPDIVGLLAGED